MHLWKNKIKYLLIYISIINHIIIESELLKIINDELISELITEFVYN